MKIKLLVTAVITVLLLSSCNDNKKQNNPTNAYLDYSKSEDQATGGIKMIPIETPLGKFKVWTKRVGNNPKIKVLLLPF